MISGVDAAECAEPRAAGASNTPAAAAATAETATVAEAAASQRFLIHRGFMVIYLSCGTEMCTLQCAHAMHAPCDATVRRGDFCQCRVGRLANLGDQVSIVSSLCLVSCWSKS